MTEITGPAARIREYLDQSEETKGDEIDAPYIGTRLVNGVRVARRGTALTIGDLRDVLGQLEEALDTIERIAELAESEETIAAANGSLAAVTVADLRAALAPEQRDVIDLSAPGFNSAPLD